MKPASLLLWAGLTTCQFHTNTLTAGQLTPWGPNTWGLAVPTNMPNVVAVAGHSLHQLALKDDGTVFAWGSSGDWVTNVPANLSNVIAIATGDYHGLALRVDGTVVSWGTYEYGLTNVGPFADIVGIAAGDFHSVALRANGTVAAWGNNTWGQTLVPGDLTNVVAVSANNTYSLALRANGTITAWGDSPIIVPSDLTNAIAVSAGRAHCLALRVDGTIAAWGGGYNGEIDVPPGLSNIVAVSAGTFTSVALKCDGTVVCWGAITNIPAGLAGVTAIGAGGNGLQNIALTSATPQPAINFAGPPVQTIGVGSEAFFSASVSGALPLSYQWYFGTNAILGANNPWLVLRDIQSSQSGEYTLRASNNQGSTTSQPMTLFVVPALDIHLVPAITLKGAIGSSYRIEYANAGPDNGWNLLDTVTLTNAEQFYFDASAIGQPARFYRLVQLP